ncbi:hypothetical protein H0H87_007095 [Tephrocybe sp. NHM501043]|nr:hypothetical protein H0H87_007095 [Tephrocybe sp. NHM501043]
MSLTSKISSGRCRESLSWSHLHKEKDPFIFVCWTSLADTQRVFNLGRKNLQNGVNFA